MTNLETTYLGLKLRNPLIAASSGMTSTVERMEKLEEAGIGAVVVKSVFEEQINNEVTSLMQQDSHQTGYPEAEDYIHHYLRDNTLSKHFKLISETKKKTKIPVIASVNC